MKRRAYGLLVAVALVMGLTAVVTSMVLGQGLKDPDGSLGPSWFRLPMMVLGAFVIDVVPRSLWRSRRRITSFPSQAKAIIDEHWTRERISLVVIGLVSFYVTYVSYRNLKNFLPQVYGKTTYDHALHQIDKFLMFGHEPAIVLHGLLGETVASTWAATSWPSTAWSTTAGVLPNIRNLSMWSSAMSCIVGLTCGRKFLRFR